VLDAVNRALAEASENYRRIARQVRRTSRQPRRKADRRRIRDYRGPARGPLAKTQRD
jgi:hypothetical protein